MAPNSYVEFVLIPKLVARLRQAAPGIRLRLVPFGNDLGETGAMSGDTAMVLGRIVEPPDSLVVQHLMDDGLACVVRADHPRVGDALTPELYESLQHVNVLPPGRMRAGLFQALERKGIKREVAVSVTHFLAVPEIVAVTDHCATLPLLVCRHLVGDPRLKVLPAASRPRHVPGRARLACPLSQRSRPSLAALDRGGAGTGTRGCGARVRRRVRDLRVTERRRGQMREDRR